LAFFTTKRMLKYKSNPNCNSVKREMCLIAERIISLCGRLVMVFGGKSYIGLLVRG